MKISEIFNPPGVRDADHYEVRLNTIGTAARIIILACALSIFLPYYITSIVVGVAGLTFCILPGTRDKIFIHKGAFTLALFTLVTAVVSVVHKNYMGLLRTGVFAAMMVIFFVARALATKIFYERLLDLICAGGTVSSIGAVIELILHKGDRFYRSSALFVNPNFFGAAIMLTILICAYKAVVRNKNAKLFYFVAIVNAAGLYACGSMALWGVLFIGILILLLLNHEYRLLAIFFGVAATVLVTIVLVPQLIPRLNEISATTENRVIIWEFAIEQIKKAPVFGRGFFSYRFLYYQLSPGRPEIYKAALAHNILLDCMLSHGIVGTALIGIFMGQFVKTVFECHDGLKSRGDSYVITTFIAAVAGSCAFYGMIDTTLIWVQNGMILLFIASGIGVDERRLRHKQHAEHARTDKTE